MAQRQPVSGRPTVLIVTGEYPPMVGGLADHTACLGRALTAAGWRVTVLTATDAAPGTAVLPIVRRWDWSLGEPVQRAVRSFSPDVIHLQYQTAAYQMHPAICLLPALARFGGSPPVVVQMHDLRLPYLLPKAGPLRRTITRTLIRWSDAVILTNQADFQGVDRWLDAAAGAGLAPAGRPAAHLIPIGANVELDPPPDYDRAAWRAGLGVAPETLLIGFFGLANQSKGLDDLLAAVRRVRDAGQPVKLVIIGGATGASDPTNRAAQARLHQAIAELGLTDPVHLTGTLAPRAVSAHLLAVDLAALPFRDGASFRRGSLLAVIAHGRPLITTAGPDPADRQVPGAELRDGANCRLVPPGNAAALAAAIRELAADPAARERLGTGARQLAAAFGWPGIAAQTIAAYERALADRATAPARWGRRAAHQPGPPSRFRRLPLDRRPGQARDFAPSQPDEPTEE